jgi:excisionase family DNA binding protein
MQSTPITLAEQIERTGRALTADDLANLLSVSRITIFKQAKAGRIPSFRIGTCVRFDPKAVVKQAFHNVSEQQAHTRRRERLEQIVHELSVLKETGASSMYRKFR